MTNQESKNEGGLSKAWLLALIIPAFAFILWQFFSYVNSTNMGSVQDLNTRITVDEGRINSELSDISQIKTDVAYIKGLLVQKLGYPLTQTTLK